MTNPFSIACEAAGPLALSIECQGSPEVECRTYDTPFVLIGRNALSDLRLPNADVSDRHAYLQVIRGQLFFVDLGSRRGIHRAGKRQHSGWIEEGQSMRIGPYRIRPIGRVDDKIIAGDVPPVQMTLELSHRSLRSSRFEIHSELVLVGSAADCDVRLLDPSVSNYHCSLIQTPTGVWVIDLLGRGGLSLNGTSIRYGRVLGDNVLRLGNSQIRFLIDRESRRAEPSTLGGPWPECLNSLPNHHPTDSSPDKSNGPLESTFSIAEGPDPDSCLAPNLRESQAGEEGKIEVTHHLENATARVPESGDCLARLAPEQTALVDALIAPLADQFDRLQHHLVEQFQQAGMLLFETFSALHEEHLGVLREEVGSLRHVRQELEKVRIELQNSLPSTSASPREGPGRALPYSIVNEPTSLVTRHNHADSHTSSDDAIAAEVCELSGSDDDTSSTSRSAGTASAIKLSTAEIVTPGAFDTSNGRKFHSERKVDAEIHSLLYQRITTLENEQQSRWQKILGMMPTRKANS